MKKYQKSKSGFGLLEVTVAVTILVMFVVASFSLGIKTSQATTLSKNRLVANYLAQAKIEDAKTKLNGLNYANSTWSAEAITKLTSTPPDSTVNNIQYTTTKTASATTANPNTTAYPSDVYLGNNMINYTVTVSWQELGGQQEVKTTTRFSNWEPN